MKGKERKTEKEGFGNKSCGELRDQGHVGACVQPWLRSVELLAVGRPGVFCRELQGLDRWGVWASLGQHHRFP